MPQIVNWRTPPEQLREHLREAREILGEFGFTPAERVALFPVCVELLAEKALIAVPDPAPVRLPSIVPH